MISFFPSFMNDELLYSLLARYYTETGYINYTYVAEDLFISKHISPDIEFVNAYTPDAKHNITRTMSMKEVIEKHTMFSCYGRFIRNDKRSQCLDLMDPGNAYISLLSMPHKEGNERYLRYCPECAKSDREKYGFTYWHRTHQMQGVKVCPLHGCYLMASGVELGKKRSSNLYDAEIVIPENIGTVIYTDNELEWDIAKYCMGVFTSNLMIKTESEIDTFLDSKLQYTQYKSKRGEAKRISLLYEDFKRYYHTILCEKDYPKSRMEKVFSGNRHNFYEICLLAYFLNVSVKDLSAMKSSEESQKEVFDNAVLNMHKQGYSYRQIAEMLNASYDMVKMIGCNKYGHGVKAEKNARGGAKSKDWNSIDEATLPNVRQAIVCLRGGHGERPRRINQNAVQKYLGLPCKSIDKMKLCKKEIEKYYESKEQFWAREIVWAYETILDNGDIVHWTNIRRLTNIRKSNYLSCMPYISEYASTEVSCILKGLVTE